MQSNSTTSVHIVLKLNAQTDPTVISTGKLVEEIAKDAGLRLVDKNNLAAGTLVIAIGGDGTMIEAMHRAVRCNGYALGINLGNVGFLTDISVKNTTLPMYGVLKAMMSDMRWRLFGPASSIVLEERYVLENSRWPTLAVNDVSISSLESDEMIKYRLLIDQHDAGVHRANSLLVSTATGSTAYALSAGGALLMPDMQSIQVVPVAPATMTSRPLIISGKSKVTVQVYGPGVSVRVDGQKMFSSNTSYTKDEPFELIINRHNTPATVVHPKGWNYFDVLTNKLGWRHG